MKIKQQLAALIWAVRHMEETMAGCQHFKETKNKTDILRHVLFSGIITSYTRSFVECSGISSLKGKFDKFDDPRYAIEHKRICDARRYIYGHRDTKNETSIFENTRSAEELNLIKITLKEKNVGTEISFDARRSSLPDEYAERIGALAELQLERMKKALNDMLEVYAKSVDLKPGTYEI